MQCVECFRILALKDDSSLAWNVLEELETHFSRDHFQLNIYSCPICFEEKFPTEYKLIEHFANSHKNQSTIKVTYTLDPTVVHTRLQIRECISQCYFGKEKVTAASNGGCDVPAIERNASVGDTYIQNPSFNSQLPSQDKMAPHTFREHNAKVHEQLLEELVTHSPLDDSNGRFTPEEGMETMTMLPNGTSVCNFIHMDNQIFPNTNNGAAKNLASTTLPLTNRLLGKLNGNIVYAEQPPTAPQISPPPNSIQSNKHPTSLNKRRKIKLSRDINMPPRPISGYLLFSNANRSVIEHMAKQKNISYDSMLKDLWNDPQHTNKQHWKDKYIKMRVTYKEELKIRKLKDALTNHL